MHADVKKMFDTGEVEEPEAVDKIGRISMNSELAVRIFPSKCPKAVKNDV